MLSIWKDQASPSFSPSLKANLRHSPFLCGSCLEKRLIESPEPDWRVIDSSTCEGHPQHIHPRNSYYPGWNPTTASDYATGAGLFAADQWRYSGLRLTANC